MKCQFCKRSAEGTMQSRAWLQVPQCSCTLCQVLQRCKAALRSSDIICPVYDAQLRGLYDRTLASMGTEDWSSFNCFCWPKTASTNDWEADLERVCSWQPSKLNKACSAIPLACISKHCRGPEAVTSSVSLICALTHLVLRQFSGLASQFLWNTRSVSSCASNN